LKRLKMNHAARGTLSLILALGSAACGVEQPTDFGAPDAGNVDLFAASDASVPVADLAPSDGPASAPCRTRISYGQAWIHPAQHPAQSDVASGAVTWDGRCIDEGANSYALLSNGYKPYFQGHSACVIALDLSSECGTTTACTTRITYGASWLPPANHAAQYDD